MAAWEKKDYRTIDTYGDAVAGADDLGTLVVNTLAAARTLGNANDLRLIARRDGRWNLMAMVNVTLAGDATFCIDPATLRVRAEQVGGDTDWLTISGL